MKVGTEENLADALTNAVGAKIQRSTWHVWERVWESIDIDWLLSLTRRTDNLYEESEEPE